MSRRSRAQVFEQLVNKIKKRKFIGRAELLAEILTNPDLFKKCIQALKDVGMIEFRYDFSPSGHQREILVASSNIDDQNLYIKALSKVLAPSLFELIEEYYGTFSPDIEISAHDT